jgi:arsenite methyltransferase
MAGLPYPDARAHVVISNGAINLSPRKACVLREAFRVLVPGGRLYIADIVREAEAPQAESTTGHSRESWANCVAGTLTPRWFLQIVTKAGFVKVTFIGTERAAANDVGQPI